MSKKVYGPFPDWTDLEAVKTYARRLGPGQLVIKKAGRPNYNITFASRRDTYQPGEVIYETSPH